jgi:hypothetical protein
MRTFTKDTALSELGRGAALHVWINERHVRGTAWERHGRGVGTACYVWIGLSFPTVLQTFAWFWHWKILACLGNLLAPVKCVVLFRSKFHFLAQLGRRLCRHILWCKRRLKKHKINVECDENETYYLQIIWNIYKTQDLPLASSSRGCNTMNFFPWKSETASVQDEMDSNEKVWL